jgi:hypothetical protein
MERNAEPMSLETLAAQVEALAIQNALLQARQIVLRATLAGFMADRMTGGKESLVTDRMEDEEQRLADQVQAAVKVVRAGGGSVVETLKEIVQNLEAETIQWDPRFPLVAGVPPRPGGPSAV